MAAEQKTLDEKLDAALDLIATRGFAPGITPKPDDVLKMSQSVLNLAHAKQLLSGKK